MLDSITGAVSRLMDGRTEELVVGAAGSLLAVVVLHGAKIGRAVGRAIASGSARGFRKWRSARRRDVYIELRRSIRNPDWRMYFVEFERQSFRRSLIYTVLGAHMVLVASLAQSVEGARYVVLVASGFAGIFLSEAVAYAALFIERSAVNERYLRLLKRELNRRDAVRGVGCGKDNPRTEWPRQHER